MCVSPHERALLFLLASNACVGLHTPLFARATPTPRPTIRKMAMSRFRNTSSALFAGASRQISRAFSSGESVDVAIVGAGHNGLVAAVLLARQGLNVSASTCDAAAAAAATLRGIAHANEHISTTHMAVLALFPHTQVEVFEEQAMVGGACRTEYPFKKVPGLGHSTGEKKKGRRRRRRGGGGALGCLIKAPPHTQQQQQRPLKGAYLLGVMPPELIQVCVCACAASACARRRAQPKPPPPHPNAPTNQPLLTPRRWTSTSRCAAATRTTSCRPRVS